MAQTSLYNHKCDCCEKRRRDGLYAVERRRTSGQGWLQRKLMPVGIYDLALGYGMAMSPHGLRAHITLLSLAWTNSDGPGRLENSDDLHRLALVSKRVWRRVKAEALMGFVLDDGFWVHDGLVADAAMAADVCAKNDARAIGLRTRFATFQRDGFRYVYCGRSVNEGVRLHVDHVKAVSKGGTSNPDNLVTACSECNAGKAASELMAPPADRLQ